MHEEPESAAERDRREFVRRYDAAGGKLLPPKSLEEALAMTEHERCAHYMQAKFDGNEEEAARLWEYVLEISARRQAGQDI